MKSSEAMSRKEEEKEAFEPAMSRSDRRKSKRTPKEPLPTSTTSKPTKPDKIGGQEETAERMGPEDKPREKKSYADAAAEPKSSSAKTKNPPKAKSKPRSTENSRKELGQVPNVIISSARLEEAMKLSASPSSILTDPTAAQMEESLPKLATPSQTKKRKASSGGAAEKAIDYNSMDRKVFGKVLKWKGVGVNGFVIRAGDKYLTMPKTKICGLDMVEALEDGTLVFPGSVPNFLPKTNISDIAEYIFEIYCHLRPDIFGSFEPLPDELQEGDEKKFTLDNQDQSRGENCIEGAERCATQQ